ncbi:Sec-independent protein translocase protein TatB [Nocardia africana]|uniref:Sec-independent protein translocase protein TatB n=1 Tax=Nocardia africana TaxID=134964 RepID=A0A378X3Y5_9NOCA|nr:Sec-independent protein translocase protein TatB [Nocardia africana]MCC3316987.1 Sec-independent protein translocase protein TatB [Nocardia africana]SUA47717.1 Sec-independent protein translocase protein TatB [Nocardia africana]
MFNIGWPEMVILVVAALVILGPERLPGAIRWTAQSLRQVRDYASGATSQLRNDLGPELDELRKPLEELNELRKPLEGLRGMTPRSMVTKHLFDGDDSLFTGTFGAANPGNGSSGGSGISQTGSPNSVTPPGYSVPEPPKPLDRNEKPPIDFDAT